MVHRLGLDLALLWLWCRPAAVAPIWPLAWEFPRATGTAKNKNKIRLRSSCRVSVETNLTRNHEVAGSIPDLAQGVNDPALP